MKNLPSATKKNGPQSLPATTLREPPQSLEFCFQFEFLEKNLPAWRVSSGVSQIPLWRPRSPPAAQTPAPRSRLRLPSATPSHRSKSCLKTRNMRYIVIVYTYIHILHIHIIHIYIYTYIHIYIYIPSRKHVSDRFGILLGVTMYLDHLGLGQESCASGLRFLVMCLQTSMIRQQEEGL